MYDGVGMLLEKTSFLSDALVLPGRALKRRSFSPFWLALLALPFPSLVAALGVFGPPPWSGEVWTLVSLTLLAQGLGLFAAERVLRHPSREGWGVALMHLLLATLLLLAFLALGRLYYSRAYLFLSTLLGVFPYLLLVWLAPPVRLLLLPGRGGEWLRQALKDRLAPCPAWGKAAGVAAELEDLEPEAYRGLISLWAEGLPLYDPVSVYEALQGRVPLALGPKAVLRSLADRSMGLYTYLKRFWEVGLILVFSPLIFLLLALVALLVYLDLGRPVIFAQERMGWKGRPFRAYKFRTMRGAPRSGVYAGDEGDRITPLGRWLRRFRLDELPQLWNVLRGEMALIGPRPEQYVLAKAYEEANPLYALRHAVRPGLTGWAQVHHGYAEGLEGAMEKLEYDLYYVKHMSFWLDLNIVVATFRTILTGFGAK